MTYMKDAPVITIDGPSGSGKGTITQRLAKYLGWHILDSGALYRLTALSITNRNIDPEDVSAAAKMADNLDVKFEVVAENEPVAVFLDGQNVTNAIRTEECGAVASKIAAYPEVREALLQRQRNFQQPPGLVADGRDMGTIVFPKAKCKIYLTATAEERAQRRHIQLKQQGQSVRISHLLKEIRDRDYRDMSRDHAPLCPAEDAITIDTSGLSIDLVLDKVVEIWSKKVGKK